MHDLSHDAFGVQHRLARVDIVKFTLVNDNLVLLGIQVDRQQFSDLAFFTHFEGRTEQASQPNVFRFQCGKFLHLCLLHELLGSQADILLLQLPAGCQ